jgi:SAM-dependent methyltransferase
MVQAFERPRAAVGEGHAHETHAPDVETAGPAYAARFAGATGAWLLDVQARTLLRLLAALPGRLSVLDVGGGHGQLTRTLGSAGHRVVVHGSQPACHARRAGGPVPRLAADPWRLPLRDRSFDVVVSVRLLAHVEAWRELLGEMARVARRGVAVDFPVRGALHRLAPALFETKKRLEGNTRPYFDYLPSEVAEALGAAGLSDVRVARQFAWPMVLHRTLGAPRLSRALEGLARGLGATRRAGSPALMLALRPADDGSRSAAGQPEEKA